MAKKKETRAEIPAYAAFDDRGNLLYATIKPDKDSCVKSLHGFNPPVSGHHYPYKVLPVYIGVDLNKQSQFSFEEE